MPQTILTMLVIRAITAPIVTGPMLRWMLHKIDHTMPKEVADKASPAKMR